MTYQEWLVSESVSDKIDVRIYLHKLQDGDAGGAAEWLFSCSRNIGWRDGMTEASTAFKKAANAPLGTEPQS